MRALVADPSASPALSLADVPEPSPGPGQLLVRMEASSINRGEVRTAAKQPPGTVIGWDIAGSVGLLTVQLALDAKATVTGQASSEQRAAAVRDLGAEALIHPCDGSPVEGEFDVVLDGVGGPMFAPLLRATAQGGRVVVFGISSDAESTFRVDDFYPKAITIH